MVAIQMAQNFANQISDSYAEAGVSTGKPHAAAKPNRSKRDNGFTLQRALPLQEIAAGCRMV